MFLTYLLG